MKISNIKIWNIYEWTGTYNRQFGGVWNIITEGQKVSTFLSTNKNDCKLKYIFKVYILHKNDEISAVTYLI